jgi:hypothetical protein
MTTDVQPNHDASVDFLKWYAPQGMWVLMAIATDKKSINTQTFVPADEHLLRAWLKEHGTKNIYFHVNPTSRALRKKAEREDVKELGWLHVDIDPRVGEDIESERARALGLLQQPRDGIPKPSAIIFSGGGYQGFWRLEDPMPINGEEQAYEEAKLYNLALELSFGADHCHNVDRIMRLPGTINWPDKKKAAKGRVPTLAAVVELNDATYKLDTFTPAPPVQIGGGGFASAPSSSKTRVEVNVSGNIPRLSPDLSELDEFGVPDRIKVIIVQGSHPEETKKGDNSRSAWQFDVICNLVRCNVPDDMIYSVITDPDFGISEGILEKGANAERYAKRQIERAKEEAINPILREFNERFAIVGNIGGKCRVIEEVEDEALGRFRMTRQSFDDFRARYARVYVRLPDPTSPTGFKDVPAGKWWLVHPQARYYDYITFAPNKDTPKAYNLWRGYGVTARPGVKHQPFLDHALNVICKGNKEHYDYLIRWIAYGVQHPHLPGEVAVVLRGGQGTGKSRFAEWIGRLYGRHSLHISNPSHLVGNFNSHLRDCSFLFADEAFYAGDKKHESILKTLITERSVMIEAKGVDAEQQSNCIHLLIASNNNWVVPAGMDERRYLVLDVGDNHKGNHKYFAALMKALDEDGAENLLHYLLTLDLGDFNVREVPKTDALGEQKKFSMSAEDEWWYTKLREGAMLPEHRTWETRVRTEELQADYFERVRNTGVQRRATQTALGIFLGRACGDDYPQNLQLMEKVSKMGADGYMREVTARVRYYVFPSLEVCRKRFEDRFGIKGDWLTSPELDLGPQQEKGNDDDTPPF